MPRGLMGQRLKVLTGIMMQRWEIINGTVIRQLIKPQEVQQLPVRKISRMRGLMKRLMTAQARNGSLRAVLLLGFLIDFLEATNMLFKSIRSLQGMTSQTEILSLGL